MVVQYGENEKIKLKLNNNNNNLSRRISDISGDAGSFLCFSAHRNHHPTVQFHPLSRFSS